MNLVINNEKGQNISCEIVQHGSDVLAVMVHGFKGDKNHPIFFDLEKKIGKLGYDTIRFDFAGNGKSEGKFSESTILSQVHELDYIIEKLGYKKIILLGHSMGGAVSIIESMQNKKVKCLILLSSLVLPYITFKDSIIRFSPYVMLEGAKLPKFRIINKISAIKSAEKNITKNLDKEVIGKRFFEEIKSLDIIGYAKMIDIPVLVTHGKFDDIIPISHAEYLFNILGTEKKMEQYKYKHVSSDKKLNNIISEDIIEFINSNKEKFLK